jgi:hypothetical protein
MAISGADPAQITARAGLLRCGTARCGCAPNDVTDEDGALGIITHAEPDLYAASEGTVVDWGVGGAGAGVDELSGGEP